jgi:hypothetical protein
MHDITRCWSRLQIREAVEVFGTPAPQGGYLEAGWHGWLLARRLQIGIVFLTVPRGDLAHHPERGWSMQRVNRCSGTVRNACASHGVIHTAFVSLCGRIHRDTGLFEHHRMHCCLLRVKPSKSVAVAHSRHVNLCATAVRIRRRMNACTGVEPHNHPRHCVCRKWRCSPIPECTSTRSCRKRALST